VSDHSEQRFSMRREASKQTSAELPVPSSCSLRADLSMRREASKQTSAELPVPSSCSLRADLCRPLCRSKLLYLTPDHTYLYIYLSDTVL
jgi:hypothetical protein